MDVPIVVKLQSSNCRNLSLFADLCNCTSHGSGKMILVGQKPDVFASDFARKPNFAMQVRSGACPALSGRESTARSSGCRSQWIRGWEWSRSDRQGTAKKTGESWEERMRDGEVKDTHANTFFMTLEPCMYVHTHEDVRSMHRVRSAQKNVRATGKCVYTPRRTHCSCYYMCTKPWKNLSEKTLSREKMNIHHFMAILTKKKSSIRLGSVSVCTEPFHVRLDLSCWYLFQQLAFHQSLSERPTFLISWFSMMPLYV